MVVKHRLKLLLKRSGH